LDLHDLESSGEKKAGGEGFGENQPRVYMGGERILTIAHRDLQEESPAAGRGAEGHINRV